MVISLTGLLSEKRYLEICGAPAVEAKITLPKFISILNMMQIWS